jgi:hypothetical protein
MWTLSLIFTVKIELFLVKITMEIKCWRSLVTFILLSAPFATSTGDFVRFYSETRSVLGWRERVMDIRGSNQ